MIHPHLDDFASMLEALVRGPVSTIAKTHALDGTSVELMKLRCAVQRLKTGKCGGELGSTAELLKKAPERFLSVSPPKKNIYW